MTTTDEAETLAVECVDALSREYDEAIDALREAVAAFVASGRRPDPKARTDGSFAYPELRIHHRDFPERAPPPRAFGRLSSIGTYATTITRPRLFQAYLIEQIALLIRDYSVEVTVGRSRQEIPFPYVLEPGHDLTLDGVAPTELARWFPATELASIGDEIADGLPYGDAHAPFPAALFDALRVDFSLARLRHYTGAPAEHVQRYVLFTNYHRYVDEFVRWACTELRTPDSRYSALSGAGGLFFTGADADPDRVITDSAWRRHQMPAYHLMAPDRSGISLVNIGVGPSNAKTITDHLAVTRPDAWLMIGHCGGLRPSQRIGDYVLAHAYLRDDHVLDHVLPPEIPVPAIAEVQQALARAAETISGEAGDELKRRLRTGTVVTTDDRNWELAYSKSALRFSQSRAVGIDMESATIAAQGFRFRVPYGTLLCVSDKPLHGEIKLPGQANRFYERAINEHMQIGIETCAELRREGERLHSRKLRAFNEPPFR